MTSKSAGSSSFFPGRHRSGGFAPWPADLRGQSKATARLNLAITFVASVLFAAGVNLVLSSADRLLRHQSPAGACAPVLQAQARPDVVCVKIRKSLRQGVSAMELENVETLHEKVLGAFSLPASIRENLRFSCDGEGRLILRGFDRDRQTWRDATLDDLAPPAVDVAEARALAWSRANTRGSYRSTRQALAVELCRPTPSRAHAWTRPNGAAGRLSMQANFFVTDGLPHIESVNLIDLIEANGDQDRAWARALARTI